MEMLQKTVSDEHAEQKVVDDKFAELEDLLTASEEQAVKVSATCQFLKAAGVELASLKEQIPRADSRKDEFEKEVTKVCRESKHSMVRLDVHLLGANGAKQLTRSLATKSVDVFDALFRQPWYNAVNCLRQWLEEAYSTARVPWPVVLCCVSRVMTTSIR